jgi:hypothetical protein
VTSEYRRTKISVTDGLLRPAWEPGETVEVGFRLWRGSLARSFSLNLFPLDTASKGSFATEEKLVVVASFVFAWQNERMQCSEVRQTKARADVAGDETQLISLILAILT